MSGKIADNETGKLLEVKRRAEGTKAGGQTVELAVQVRDEEQGVGPSASRWREGEAGRGEVVSAGVMVVVVVVTEFLVVARLTILEVGLVTKKDCGVVRQSGL